MVNPSIHAWGISGSTRPGRRQWVLHSRPHSHWVKYRWRETQTLEGHSDHECANHNRQHLDEQAA